MGVDVKQITNCRFGMTSWPLLIILHGIKNWEINEGKFQDAIWISIALQLIYITKVRADLKNFVKLVMLFP